MRPQVFLATPLEDSLSELYHTLPTAKKHQLKQITLSERTWLATPLPELCSQEELENSRLYFFSLLRSLFPKYNPPSLYVLSTL